MTDIELKEIVEKLRQFTLTERQKNSDRTIDIFFVNAIEIACNLTELGISQKRPITKEEQYWFEGSYHMNFWAADIERDLYSPLIDEVTRRKWFRKMNLGWQSNIKQFFGIGISRGQSKSDKKVF